MAEGLGRMRQKIVVRVLKYRPDMSSDKSDAYHEKPISGRSSASRTLYPVYVI